MKKQYITVSNLIILICIGIYFVHQTASAQLFPSLELYYFENPNFTQLQLLSHMFMHGSVNHLLMNMLGVWMFGTARPVLSSY